MYGPKLIEEHLRVGPKHFGEYGYLRKYLETEFHLGWNSSKFLCFFIIFYIFPDLCWYFHSDFLKCWEVLDHFSDVFRLAQDSKRIGKHPRMTQEPKRKKSNFLFFIFFHDFFDFSQNLNFGAHIGIWDGIGIWSRNRRTLRASHLKSTLSPRVLGVGRATGT